MLNVSWSTLSVGNMRLRVDNRTRRVSIVLLCGLVFLVFLSLSYGDFSMNFTTVIKTLFGFGDNTQRMVVWDLRLPRVLIAAFVGMALGVSGALLQGLTRNPLADPGIIGINQGAAVAAVALFVGFDNVSIHWLPFAAFFGGAVAALIIYVCAWKNGSSPVRLVLVGIGFAAFASALTTIMVVFSDIDRVGQAYMWLSGSVYGRNWDNVWSIFAWLVVLLPFSYALALPMNALLQGDDTVKSVGVSIERMRLTLIFISVALAAAGVAAAGVFGFLGLVAPHIARMLVGSTYQGLIPVSALIGACIVVVSDLVGRSIIAPNQIPAGLITAILGAPYFFWHMRRHYARGM